MFLVRISCRRCLQRRSTFPRRSIGGAGRGGGGYRAGPDTVTRTIIISPPGVARLGEKILLTHRVVGRWRDPQLLLAAGHSRVVDGLQHKVVN